MDNRNDFDVDVWWDGQLLELASTPDWDWTDAGEDLIIVTVYAKKPSGD